MSVVVPANEEGRKFYEQAEVRPAKWLMPDGSIVDEFPMGGGGSASLDNNVEKTIDVSTYTEPVEITPTQGKDGMAKATVTLSNIPSSGGSWQTKTGELPIRVMVRVVFTDDTYAYGCLGDWYEDDGVRYTLFFAMGKDYTGPIRDSDWKADTHFTATEVMDWLTQTYNTNFETSKVADHLEVYI